LNITQTVLVFVGIPVLVVATVFAAVYGTSARRGSKRYRPGRPFTFAPVWFLAGTDEAGTNGAGTSGAAALNAPAPTAALPAGPVLAQSSEDSAHGETGGASDRW
jgi:hypothetical protein